MNRHNRTFYLLTLGAILLFSGVILNFWTDKIRTSEEGTLLFVGFGLTLLTNLVRKKFLKFAKP